MQLCFRSRRINLSSLCSSRPLRAWGQFRSHSTADRTFQEGDPVVLRQLQNPDRPPIFTARLRSGKKLVGHLGSIDHDAIIGRTGGDTINNNRNVKFLLLEPTLSDWITLSGRRVTPIYPGEASNIVHHLDLHPVSDRDPPVEVLEAGTGHGSLTLHLARAIHGSKPVSGDVIPVCETSGSRRSAVIHTVETSEENSVLAQKIVRGFRDGLYSQHVEFHVADLADFLRAESAKRELQQSPTRFLSHAVLDLPGAQDYLADVCKAMRTTAVLAVFCPNITQLVDCVKVIKNERLPLHMEHVVELGANTSVGKPWEITVQKPRRKSKERVGPNTGNTETEMSEPSTADNVGDTDVESSENEQLSDSAVRESVSSSEASAEPITRNWNVVCRPKMGYTVTGGGFLGIFRRKEDFQTVENPGQRADPD